MIDTRPIPDLASFWGRLSMMPAKNPNEPLPLKFVHLRPGQAQAIQEIVEAYATGARVVFLEAPTGSGKTLIAEIVRRRLMAMAMYLCSTRSLQTQFLGDFPYTKVIKGRANYPTWDQPERFASEMDQLTAEDCSLGSDPSACEVVPEGEGVPGCRSASGKAHCYHCHPVTLCPYTVARREAQVAPLACANMAYFLTVNNSPSALFTGRHLVVVDECDTLESALLAFVELRISPRLQRMLSSYGFPGFDHQSPPSMLSFAQDCLPVVRDAIQAILPLGRQVPPKLSIRRRLRQLRKLEAQFGAILAGAEKWVPVPERSETPDGYRPIVYRPVQVRQFGADLLWPHGTLWLCMSATVLDAQEMITSLGIPGDLPVAFVRMGSAILPSRRPIVAVPVANNIAKYQAQARPRILSAITQIAEHHRDERILVHSVSFEFGRAIAQVLQTQTGRLVFHHAGGSGAKRDALIEAYRTSNPPGILVGPGLERGLDLHQDDTRVIVIPKVTYPSTLDPQVAARMRLRMVPDGEDGERWYLLQTIRSLIQASGRATRSADDYSVTYILDAQFIERMMREKPRWRPEWLVWRDFTPLWWTQAIHWRSVGMPWLVNPATVSSDGSPTFMGPELRG
jgi:Rad3-related DNA helicase